MCHRCRSLLECEFRFLLFSLSTVLCSQPISIIMATLKIISIIIRARRRYIPSNSLNQIKIIIFIIHPKRKLSCRKTIKSMKRIVVPFSYWFCSIHWAYDEQVGTDCIEKFQFAHIVIFTVVGIVNYHIICFAIVAKDSEIAVCLNCNKNIFSIVSAFSYIFKTNRTCFTNQCLKLPLKYFITRSKTTKNISCELTLSTCL